MAIQARNHEVVLALNGYFADTVDEIKTTFDGLVDAANIRVWHPAPGVISANGQRAQEKLYEAFLSSLRPDVVHVTSLFEGLGDASITSVGNFATMPTAVTLYDLIPLINPHPYLDNANVRSWYMGKVEALRRANMWLAISESSRQEGITQLGLEADRCINISTAAYDHFKKSAVAEARQQELRERYGLNKSFVMYTGGIDHRKNLEGLIEAFALLSGDLRRHHQLAIVCSAREEDRDRLLQLARNMGLTDGDVIVTGFVPEPDLVDLYNLCKLFVFPSWHEGFGLPALEAMQCGAAVIGANTSSLPEVIGRDDALFDPRNTASIATKIAQALTDQVFREDLARHGQKQAQKFSWQDSARRALAGLEVLHASTTRQTAPQAQRHRRHRPRLAYVSPLPPERSGISDYSAALLPELSRYYEIDLIAKLPAAEYASLNDTFAVRSVEWFQQNSNAFDCVLYHFGNSHFHEHMFELIASIPGIVVLHDFFLGNIQAYREFVSRQPNRWTQALYVSHGYPAVAEYFKAKNAEDVVFKYPCNFDVLRHAQGVIVHSPHSMLLAEKWIGSAAAADWALVPLLRALPAGNDTDRRTKARAELGLSEFDILVCSFGMLNATKLNHRLLQAWLASSLANDSRCRLVFVGDNERGEYGARLEQDMTAARGRVSITGWADKEVFQRYLNAADIAIQLRALSRGETSAAVLDAMSHGTATITNANGSMAFLPSDAVWQLPDDFTNAQLVEAIESLRDSPLMRLEFGAKAQDLIRTTHSPDRCARQYADAMATFTANAALGRDGLIRSIGRGNRLSLPEFAEMAQSIAATLPLPAPRRRLFVDVSKLVEGGPQSDTQHLAVSLLQALFDSPPNGYRIEPVYAVPGKSGYRYARRFTLQFLDCPSKNLSDVWIDAQPGDIFVGLAPSLQVAPLQGAFFRRLRHLGVHVEFVIYDLTSDSRAVEGLSDDHTRWLRTVIQNDGAICISQAVADKLTEWLAQHASADDGARFKIRSFDPNSRHQFEAALFAPEPQADRTPPSKAQTRANPIT
ncbi:glycosyltransferase [Variovorax sp. EL159]|uniref:glycosyltransferase n=1 Tax=Variovorax sp. EL159 TaxID=1566270 RepID=UPI00210A176B|nr:glycosyltransferase [Variovorax sp. EL159]